MIKKWDKKICCPQTSRHKCLGYKVVCGSNKSTLTIKYVVTKNPQHNKTNTIIVSNLKFTKFFRALGFFYRSNFEEIFYALHLRFPLKKPRKSMKIERICWVGPIMSGFGSIV